MSEPQPPAPGGGRPIPPRRRVLGVDVARALAILGMLAVHVGPTDVAGLAGRLYALPHGRASVLFMLVAGMGVSLLVAARRGAMADVDRTLVWRALILLPLGLFLQELGHGVFVILQTYAVLFLVAPLVARLARRWLAVFATLSLIVGPLVHLAGVTHLPDLFDRSAVRWGEGVLTMVHRLLLSGPYPLIVWAAPFLLGVWIGRSDLRSTRVRWALAGTGAAIGTVTLGIAAVAGVAVEPNGASGLTRLLDATPHSQMPLWMLGSIGTALLVVGASLILAHARPAALWPLAAMGQLALTVYVAHLVALHVWSDVLRSDAVGSAARTVLIATVLATGLSVAWRARFARGPLEVLLRPPSARRGRPP